MSVSLLCALDKTANTDCIIETMISMAVWQCMDQRTIPVGRACHRGIDFSAETKDATMDNTVWLCCFDEWLAEQLHQLEMTFRQKEQKKKPPDCHLACRTFPYIFRCGFLWHENEFCCRKVLLNTHTHGMKVGSPVYFSWNFNFCVSSVKWNSNEIAQRQRCSSADLSFINILILFHAWELMRESPRFWLNADMFY